MLELRTVGEQSRTIPDLLILWKIERNLKLQQVLHPSPHQEYDRFGLR